MANPIAIEIEGCNKPVKNGRNFVMYDASAFLLCTESSFHNTDVALNSRVINPPTNNGRTSENVVIVSCEETLCIFHSLYQKPIPRF